MFNKLSLRMRLTVLTGFIVLSISIILTLTSMYNADSTFIKPNLNKNQALHKEITNESIPSEKQIYNMTTEMKIMEARKQFNVNSIMLMIIVVILAIIMTYIIVGKALKPLHDLSYTIKNINEHNLSNRIKISSSDDEISDITNSFNTMLDRLDKSFDNQKRFASNAAHELKTPLATIKAGIQVLKLDDTPTLEDYKENIDITEISTDRLIKVIDNLLKLTAKQTQHFNDNISLKEVLYSIEKELKPSICAKDININIKNCDVNVIGNKPLFYRALFNIIENSIKFNTQSGIIDISTALINNMISISISDTGIGIPTDEIEYIFEPFYRIDKSRSSQIGGSGLGLSIVKTIIENHNGTIEIYSKYKVGTTVVITLPYKEATLLSI